MFGPEYTKIQTVFKRDDRRVIIPGAWTLPEFEYLADRPWRWTEKVDGTNIRLHWNGERVMVGGRTDNAQVPTFLLAALAATTEPDLWRKAFPEAADATVYGEGYGPKIQRGAQYRSDPAVIIFDVRVGPWWLLDEDVADVAGKLGLEVVPVAGTWTLRDAVAAVENGSLSSSRWPNAEIEGLVGRPTVPLFSRDGHRIIAKIKGKDFTELRRRSGDSLAEQPLKALRASGLATSWPNLPKSGQRVAGPGAHFHPRRAAERAAESPGANPVRVAATDAPDSSRTSKEKP